MGEYEPDDSRNVTGTASTRDGRWTKRQARTPDASGFDPDPRDEDDLDEAYADEQSGNERDTEDEEARREGDEDDDDDDDDDEGGETITFEPDPELQRELDKSAQFRERPLSH